MWAIRNPLLFLCKEEQGVNYENSGWNERALGYFATKITSILPLERGAVPGHCPLRHWQFPASDAANCCIKQPNYQ
ncbi:MAG: hypothetical protein H0U57_05885 [Tatlockia sp.]|nr:hypothetical protein [Tatlockia sp.]